MEYRHYKSHQLINREEFIANGLERGELLATEKCGCVIIQDRTADAYIVYCHKHAAAPELYEACKTLIDYIEDYSTGGANRQWRTLYADQLVNNCVKALSKVDKGD